MRSFADQDRLKMAAASPVFRAAVWLFALVGCASLAPYVFGDHPRAFPVDFNHLWTAGKCWAQFQGPYGPCHAELLMAGDNLHLHDVPPPYFYPPASISLFLGLGFFSVGEASLIWAVVNCVVVIAASMLFAMFMEKQSTLFSRPLWFALHLGACGVLWNAGGVIFVQNNAGFVFYAGFLAALIGIQRNNFRLTAIGLFICLLKPQLGIPLILMALIVPATRRAGIYASISTAIASVAGLLAGGIVAPGLQFFKNVAAYGRFWENFAEHTSGAGFLLHAMTGMEISSFVYLALLVVITVALGALYSRDAQRNSRDLVNFAGFVTIAGLFLLPSHNNYYVVLTPIFVLLAQGRMNTIAIGIAALLFMRSWDIARAVSNLDLGYLLYNASLIDTVAITILFLIAIDRFRHRYLGGNPRISPIDISNADACRRA